MDDSGHPVAVAVMATAYTCRSSPPGRKELGPAARWCAAGAGSSGLGGFPLVSLAEAREKAFSNRKLAREGGDPAGRETFRAEGMPTFAEAAERVWNDKSPGWRHSGHAQEWMSSLDAARTALYRRQARRER